MVCVKSGIHAVDYILDYGYVKFLFPTSGAVIRFYFGDLKSNYSIIITAILVLSDW